MSLAEYFLAQGDGERPEFFSGFGDFVSRMSDGLDEIVSAVLGYGGADLGTNDQATATVLALFAGLLAFLAWMFLVSRLRQAFAPKKGRPEAARRGRRLGMLSLAVLILVAAGWTMLRPPAEGTVSGRLAGTDEGASPLAQLGAGN